MDSKYCKYFKEYNVISKTILEWKINSSKVKGGQVRERRISRSLDMKYGAVPKFGKDSIDINELGLGITFLLTPEYDEIVRIKKNSRVVYWKDKNASPEVGIIQCLKLLDGKMCAVVHFPQLIDPVENVFPNYQIPNDSEWENFENGRKKLKRYNSVIFRVKDFFDEKVSIFLCETIDELKASYRARTRNKKIIIVENNGEGNSILPPIDMNANAIGRFVSEGYLGMLGETNSCYLDSLLASFFAFNSKFDFILQTPNSITDDIPALNSKQLLAFQIREVLRCCIVNPLRKNLFCPSQNIQELRVLLSHLNKRVLDCKIDIEEFLILLCETLQLESFIKYTSGTGDFLHQSIVYDRIKDNSSRSKTVNTQQLLELSMRNQKLTFDRVPDPGLILVAPRNNGKLEHFKHIIPSPDIDITDLLRNGHRSCIVCGSFAEYQCDECFDHIEHSGIRSTSFCGGCIWAFHQPIQRKDHFSTIRKLPTQNLMENKEERSILTLTAIICLRSNHFVAFVKSGESLQSPWVLFNSDISTSSTAGIVTHFGEFISKYANSPEEFETDWEYISNQPGMVAFDGGHMYIYC